MRNIELPLSASFVLLCTITVRPPVNAGFVDVFEQVRQHLLRAPPRQHHVPLVFHLHALAVSRNQSLTPGTTIVLLRFLARSVSSTASHFANSPAATTSTSDTPSDANESPGNHAQGTAAVTPSGKVLPARTSAWIARSHNACPLGFPALAFGGGQGSPNPLHGTGNK